MEYSSRYNFITHLPLLPMGPLMTCIVTVILSNFESSIDSKIISTTAHRYTLRNYVVDPRV